MTEKKSIDLISKQDLLKKLEFFFKRGDVLYCCLDDNQELISGVLIIKDKDRLIYDIGASYIGTAKKPAAHLLHDYIIKKHNKSEFIIYDFGGIDLKRKNPQMENINRFKLQFSKDIIVYNDEINLIYSRIKMFLINSYLYFATKK